MMTTFRRSMIFSAPFCPATATNAPHPEWTRTPMAADFISEYCTPEQAEAISSWQKSCDDWWKMIPATLLSFAASHHHPPATEGLDFN
jgi:hypothetical protein